MIEMVAAMLILMIGLIALASAIGYALMVSNSGRNITNTKLLVVSVLEEIETLRNTKQLSFNQLANVNAVDNTGASRNFSGFSNGYQPIAMDPANMQMIYGPDGIMGTDDDVTDPTLVLPGYSRQIVISNLNGNLKKIEVTLKFPGNNGTTQTLTGVSYLNDDAHSNYLR